MKKRLIFESATIAVILTTLMCASVLASYPGPDSKSKTVNGSYGSGVQASVIGYYASGVTPRRYNNAYWLVQRWPGSANYNGYLWFWITVGTDVIEWYTSESSYQTSSAVSTTHLAVRCRSGFYYGASSWYLDTGTLHIYAT